MILNQAQAQAAYGAMCALNNVAGRVDCRIQESIVVKEMVSGAIYVSSNSGPNPERHDDQSAFAKAYGLN